MPFNLRRMFAQEDMESTGELSTAVARLMSLRCAVQDSTVHISCTQQSSSTAVAQQQDNSTADTAAVLLEDCAQLRTEKRKLQDAYDELRRSFNSELQT
jgi:hypothetical protein